MANVIKKATNKFTKGLVMDFSPENTKNEVLTNALNATLLTFNGNELSLQNDMGNARVESAFLPEGYIPVGTCEYGGIIYIVSYNPLEDKSLIGCFPSPERNISRSELGLSDVTLSYTQFLATDSTGEPTGVLMNVSNKVLLRDSSLNPGDKFIVYADDSMYGEKLQDLLLEDENIFKLINNPLIKLSVVSIQDNGKIVYLTNDVVKYSKTINGTTYRYHLLGNEIKAGGLTDQDLDSYRNVLSSGYSVFREKTSGKLAILAELVMIDSFSVTHSIVPGNIDSDWLEFNIYLHPEVSPEVAGKYDNITPKLKYYYSNIVFLKVMKYNSINKLAEWLEINNNNVNTINLSEIISTNRKDTNDLLQKVNLSTMGLPFLTSNYYGHSKSGSRIQLYKDNSYKISSNVDISDIVTSEWWYCKTNDQGLDVWDGEVYSWEDYDFNEIEKDRVLVFFPVNDSIFDRNYFLYDGVFLLQIANIEDYDVVSRFDEYPSYYLPSSGKYEDLLYQTIKLPKVLTDAKVNLPFKFGYTITPCMEYGKLDHLAVSNTIDFSNLFKFELSKFTTWKYRIDGNLLMLTFGAEVYDTFETYKVDALVFEFYDWRGFAGSLEISNKKSYSGKFTKTLSLNTLGTLSKRKIKFNSEDSDYGRYIDTYAHNVNIIKTGESEVATYQLDGRTVKPHEVFGWVYTKDGDITKDDVITNDDCGALYSNLIYMVKPYFRVTENDGRTKFIKKDDLVLFTLPIYNEYYYSVDDFNTLKDPKLKLLLTYRLENEGGWEPYSAVGFSNGYKFNDLDNINTYKLGKYSEKSLVVDKYIKYSGTSKLQLEVGLLKDYELYNLSCDSSINEQFTCKLQLINSAGEEGFDVLRGEETYECYGSSLQLSTSSPIKVSDYNFIVTLTDAYIPIEYSFVIPYKVSIHDIKSQSIPTTTVCALFHKLPNGLYNYEDFNIYVKYLEDGGELYLSDLIFYNSGDEDTLKFGLCRMVDPDATYTYDLCTSYQEYTRPVVLIDTPGILNAGDPIKLFSSMVGKLAFFSPYIYSLYSTSKAFLHPTGSDGLGDDELVLSPIYTMVANTEQSLNNYSKVMVVNSTPSWKAPAGKLNGLNAKQLSVYNKQILDYMKYTYVYNPDYDMLQVLSGTVSVEDLNLSISSNLISKTVASPESINGYVKLGAVTIETYINDLTYFTNSSSDSRLIFKPDLTYCGTDNNPYLVSPLTYEISPNNSMVDDLRVDLENSVVVKHHDGNYDIILGNVDKRALYGWFKHYDKLVTKLVLLDVSILLDNINKPNIDGKWVVRKQQKTISVIHKQREYNDINDINKPVIHNLSEILPTTEGLMRIKSHMEFSVKDHVMYFKDREAGYVYFINFYKNLALEDALHEFNATYKANVYNYSSNFLLLTINSAEFINDMVCRFVPFYVTSSSGNGVIFLESAVIDKTFEDAVLPLKEALGKWETKHYNYLINEGKLILDGFEEIENIANKFIHNGYCTISVGDEERDGDLNTGYTLERQPYDYAERVANISKDILYGGMVVTRIKVYPKITVDIGYTTSILDYPESIVPIPKTTNCGEFTEVSEDTSVWHYYTPFLGQPTIGNSTMTVNDLQYYPSVTGHRLFLRSDKYRVNGSLIAYRKSSYEWESSIDLTKNTLRLFCGPAYNINILT